MKRLLAAYSAAEALRILHERSKRSPSSPLFSIEVETLRTLERDDEAIRVIKKGIKSASVNHNPHLHAEMLRHHSLIMEKGHLLDKSLEDIEEALSVLDERTDVILYLQLAVAKLRLLRKLDRTHEREELAKKTIKMLTPRLIQNIRKLPALLRETTAELGDADDRLLDKAIETIGLEVGNDEQKELLAEVLFDWNTQTKKSNEVNSLSDYARIKEVITSQKNWRQWIDDNEGSNLDKFIRQSMRRFQLSTDQLDSLMDTFKNTVDQTIIGKFKDKL